MLDLCLTSKTSKVCLVHASAIAIIGYVPDYRFNGIDWDKARRTHQLTLAKKSSWEFFRCLLTFEIFWKKCGPQVFLGSCRCMKIMKIKDFHLWPGNTLYFHVFSLFVLRRASDVLQRARWCRKPLIWCSSLLSRVSMACETGMLSAVFCDRPLFETSLRQSWHVRNTTLALLIRCAISTSCTHWGTRAPCNLRNLARKYERERERARARHWNRPRRLHLATT